MIMHGQPPTPLPGDLGEIVEARALHGGDVAEVWDARLDDGRRVVVKRSTTDATLEAEGLAALREAGAPTPAVLAATREILVLEHVSGPGDPRALGRAIAAMHAAGGAAFGWHRDNALGPITQDNSATSDWPAFYLERRLAPHLRWLPGQLARRVEAATPVLARMLDHDVAPNLVHGDLWIGNIVDHRWLIDPAVHYADREYDLAVLELFGRAPTALLDGYRDVWPLDDGWRDRRPVLQLAHLALHVRLFGHGWADAVAQRLDASGC